jgi:ABC-2 type transport system ATP-binding protein
MSEAESVVRVEDLRMRYGSNDVLDGVRFEVRRGEVVTLLGPNGAGKTTTIEILEGFRVRSAGNVTVLGVDPVDAPEEWRAHVGIVLQSWRDHARWTPRGLLSHLGRYYEPYGTGERSRPYDVELLISVVGLEEQADRKIRLLSGGERRRLDVAVGIVGRPELLFLDEPTSGFDPQARRDFHGLVRRLVDLEDTTILLTTHDLDEAERLADRILILAGGRIVADGSAEELARAVSGESRVRWRVNGEARTERTPDATGFVRDLFARFGTHITDLDVRGTTLEDTYLAMVQQHESGRRDEAAQAFEEVER